MDRGHITRLCLAWRMRNCKKADRDALLLILQDIISQHIHGALSSMTQGLLGSSDDSRESLLAQKLIGVVSWSSCWWGDHVQRQKWTQVRTLLFQADGIFKIIMRNCWSMNRPKEMMKKAWHEHWIIWLSGVVFERMLRFQGHEVQPSSVFWTKSLWDESRSVNGSSFRTWSTLVMSSWQAAPLH